ncbi:MAG: DUF1801 domain-containing protein [Betaproteobacteria bacterium]
MATRKAGTGQVGPKAVGAREVDDFMRDLDHPLKPELQAVRAIILGASPEISEAVKWNSPSFRVNEFFATISIRKDMVWVILHLGAKVRDNSTAGMAISDPAGLLEWLARERCAAKFRDMHSIKAGKSAFENIVRQWIACL